MIKVETIIQAPIEKVWEFWTTPEHITNWNFASEDWCCPTATNDIKPGGKFNWRMEAKDGSAGFDFSGTYVEIKENEFISYRLDDDRKVEINFSSIGDKILLSESFETEGTHTDEQQRIGWQAILENFKKYVESNNT